MPATQPSHLSTCFMLKKRTFKHQSRFLSIYTCLCSIHKYFFKSMMMLLYITTISSCSFFWHIFPVKNWLLFYFDRLVGACFKGNQKGFLFTKFKLRQSSIRAEMINDLSFGFECTFRDGCLRFIEFEIEYIFWTFDFPRRT